MEESGSGGTGAFLDGCSIGISEVFNFRGRFAVLFEVTERDNETKTGKIALLPVSAETRRLSLADSSEPKLNILDCEVVWSVSTKKFFLPFRIESGLLIYARYHGMERGAEDAESAAENRNVHAVSLHKLFSNHDMGIVTNPVQFDPALTAIHSNYPKGSHLEKVENRVINVKEEYVVWLKSGIWDYFIPARQELVDRFGYRNRKRRLDELEQDTEKTQFFSFKKLSKRARLVWLGLITTEFFSELEFWQFAFRENNRC